MGFKYDLVITQKWLLFIGPPCMYLFNISMMSPSDI